MLLKIKICCAITPCPLLNTSRRFERNILPSFWGPIRPRAWIWAAWISEWGQYTC